MTSDFVPCLACDILNGMPLPGGILFDNERWFVFHSPPRACLRHAVVLAPKRHVLDQRSLRKADLPQLADIERAVTKALRVLVPGATIRIERQGAARFGHLAWLMAVADGDPRPMAARLAAVEEPVTRVWAAELEHGFDEQRIAAHGGRLPPPPRIPGDAERSTVRAPGTHFCRHCGAKLVRDDYVDNVCHGCGKPVV